jgi:hypothetical protein
MKSKTPPVPELGSLGWLVFDPQAGREQAGRRPAIVLSHTRYNEKTGLAVFCPITSKVKGPLRTRSPEWPARRRRRALRSCALPGLEGTQMAAHLQSAAQLRA